MKSLSNDLSQDATADGSKFDGLLIRTLEPLLKTRAGDPSRTHKFTGTRNSPVEEMPLVFVPLVYTADQSLACRNQQVLQGLGTIDLSLFWGEHGQVIANPTYPNGPVDQAPIHRALEAELDMTERTAHGHKQELAPQAYCTFRYNNPGVPFAQFKFYYRNKDILKRKAYSFRSSARSPTLTGSSVKSEEKPDIKTEVKAEE